MAIRDWTILDGKMADYVAAHITAREVLYDCPYGSEQQKTASDAAYLLYLYVGDADLSNWVLDFVYWTHYANYINVMTKRKATVRPKNGNIHLSDTPVMHELDATNAVQIEFSIDIHHYGPTEPRLDGDSLVHEVPLHRISDIDQREAERAKREERDAAARRTRTTKKRTSRR